MKSGLLMLDDWITVKPNGEENKGQHAFIGKNGEIIKGLGKENKGKTINELKEETKNNNSDTRIYETEPFEVTFPFQDFEERPEREIIEWGKQYYSEHFVGNKVEREGFGIIEFRKDDFGEFVNKAHKNMLVFAVIPYIDKIIKEGIQGEREEINHDRGENDEFIAFVPFIHNAIIKGKKRRVKIKVGETRDHKYCYCLLVNGGKKSGKNRRKQKNK